MRCPICDVPMKEVERLGVLIDVCPDCKGVWLDRGELNKLLEAEQARQTDWPRYDYDHDRYEGFRNSRHDHGHKERRKRKSLLSELFEVFD